MSKRREFYVRPFGITWAIYEYIGFNRAEVVFEGTQQECYAKLRELQAQQQ